MLIHFIANAIKKFSTCWFIKWFSGLDKKEKCNKKSKNYDDKCFQYTTTIALNFDKIKNGT